MVMVNRNSNGNLINFEMQRKLQIIYYIIQAQNTKLKKIDLIYMIY